MLFALACGSVLALSACDQGAPKAPTGQVVASVGGREITRRELQTEMTGLTAATPAIQKEQQKAALQRLVQRAILVNAAKEQGVDKDPAFALLAQRATDMVMVQMLERKVLASVPAPSGEEVAQFMQTNPDMFAQRRLFDVEQIRMPLPSDAKVIKQLEPLKTMDEVAAFLAKQNISFQRGANVMDARGQDPKLLKAIIALPPGEIFILSSRSEVFLNQIRNTRLQPFEGKEATQFALNSLKAQRSREVVARQLRGYLSKAQQDVRMSAEFTTPPPGAKPQPKPQPR
jgi:EpsD family peptidyl-prolyl cis-trans isomerase